MAQFADVAPYLAVVVSVAATQVLLVFSECHESCRGYMVRGLCRMWPFLMTALAIQSVIGFVLYEFVVGGLLNSDGTLQRLAGAGAVGFATVVLPNGLIARRVEKLLARPAADLARGLERPLSRVVLWIWVLRHFKATVQGLKSIDNFDYQFQERDWDFCFCEDKEEAEKVAARRLRILFELQKAEIANNRRQPTLLNMDVNFFPGNRFFLLVAHLGRKRLRRLLSGAVRSRVGKKWDGSERRKKKGRRNDRAQPDPNPAYGRVGDDRSTLELVKEGRLY